MGNRPDSPFECGDFNYIEAAYGDDERIIRYTRSLASFCASLISCDLDSLIPHPRKAFSPACRNADGTFAWYESFADAREVSVRIQRAVFNGGLVHADVCFKAQCKGTHREGCDLPTVVIGMLMRDLSSLLDDIQHDSVILNRKVRATSRRQRVSTDGLTGDSYAERAERLHFELMAFSEYQEKVVQFYSSVARDAGGTRVGHGPSLSIQESTEQNSDAIEVVAERAAEKVARVISGGIGAVGGPARTEVVLWEGAEHNERNVRLARTRSAYLEAHGDVPAAMKALEDSGNPVARSTFYNHLDALDKEIPRWRDSVQLSNPTGNLDGMRNVGIRGKSRDIVW
ncbi:MAG: hypothetical protein IPM33_13155 [Phycisphaerales bacterium]|nr:hypothetical protein [Phycisphaerales bacterium]